MAIARCYLPNDVYVAVRLRFLSARLASRSRPVAVAVAGACIAFAVALPASAAALDGTYSGQYSCEENLAPASKAKAPFSVQIELRVKDGRISGRRENPQTVDAFSGSIDASGRLAVDLAGSWKDEPSRRWVGRFSGVVLDGAVRANGEMLTPDGRSKLRECALSLTFSAEASQPIPPVVNSEPPKEPTPRLPQAQVPTESKPTTLPVPTAPKLQAQQLSPRVVKRLDAFRHALNAVGNDPTRPNEALADDVSDAYDKGHFGNSFQIECSPLQGPYELERLGRVVSQRPFSWTPELASSVELHWQKFVTACPQHAQFGETFLAAVRQFTEERAKQVFAAKAANVKVVAESDAAKARFAEQKRLERQRQDDVSQLARSDRQRQKAESEQQRRQDVKSGKVTPLTVAGQWNCKQEASSRIARYDIGNDGVFQVWAEGADGNQGTSSGRYELRGDVFHSSVTKKVLWRPSDADLRDPSIGPAVQRMIGKAQIQENPGWDEFKVTFPDSYSMRLTGIRWLDSLTRTIRDLKAVLLCKPA